MGLPREGRSPFYQQLQQLHDRPFLLRGDRQKLEFLAISLRGLFFVWILSPNPQMPPIGMNLDIN